MKYSVARSSSRWQKIIVIVVGVVAILVVAISLLIRHIYLDNLRPAGATQRSVIVTIPSGSSVHDIALSLKQKTLIRSDWAFEWYVRSHEIGDQLQAGTYELRPSQSAQEIVTILTQGKIFTNLVTILPSQRIDQIRAALIRYGFSADAVDQALNPKLYANHPALVDKPASADLEGYLYPESFQKTAETKPADIIRQSLDQMEKRLTPDLRAAFAHEGLSVYQAITLASIVEKEVSKAEDRPIVAQVFLKRLQVGKPLESDTTVNYGAIRAGQQPDLAVDTPYNTYMHAGLPVGPISNVTDNSLNAVAHPASTDYLYFVSGDDGVTYFSHTLDEHESLVAQHCKTLCHAP